MDEVLREKQRSLLDHLSEGLVAEEDRVLALSWDAEPLLKAAARPPPVTFDRVTVKTGSCLAAPPPATRKVSATRSVSVLSAPVLSAPDDAGRATTGSHKAKLALGTCRVAFQSIVGLDL